MHTNIPLTLPADVRARLQAEATKNALSVEEYLLQVVVQGGRLLATHNAGQTQALALLDELREIGDAAEQQSTFLYLRTAVDEDRLSERKRFR